MFRLKKNINGIEFNVDFKDKINVLKSPSGSGKTFLLKTIESYCVSNNILCALIDYEFAVTSNEDLILSYCINKELILLDNADLYLTPELLKRIRSLDATIILSKKSTFDLSMEDAYLYTVKYSGSSLSTRRC